MSSLTNKIRHGDLKGVRESINGGADLSRQDRKGNTPLHVAAEGNSVEIAGILIEAGAPLNTKNISGKSPSEVLPRTEASALIESEYLKSSLKDKPPACALGYDSIDICPKNLPNGIRCDLCGKRGTI